MNFRRTVIAPTPILFNITAFIDVLLVLCFFFLLTWSNRSKETDLTISLPKSAQKHAPQAPPAPMIVNVRTSGDLNVNGRNVTFEEFTTLVGKLAQLNPDQTVVIRGDRRSQYDLVLRVLDACNAAGIISVGFAASVPATQ
ncbi:MAG: biopolymer transporter ExbD [Terrimicrobiaceae bacterium]|nr:biopolymer transporter ExbD [Terrimicrobiaceae bacterium]